jgi:hypothetical protein
MQIILPLTERRRIVNITLNGKGLRHNMIISSTSMIPNIIEDRILRTKPKY